MKKLLTALLVLTLVGFELTSVHAQDLDSANYKLLGPNISGSDGITTSTNYSQLSTGSPVDDYTTSSTNYTLRGTTQPFNEAYVPTVSCFETSTTGGTTVCTGIPGGDGMRGVCSTPGCYDRAKLELSGQGNPNDVKYAIQVSTSSNFTTGVSYVSGSTHMLKASLAITDFLFKCDWEGTSLVGYCASPNTTWQKYNILGLAPNTLYYVRLSALKTTTADGGFSQSQWGPSATGTTQNTSITFDIDIATSVAGSSTPPYLLETFDAVPENIYTSNNYVIFRSTTNALNGMQVQIKGNNGFLDNTATGDTIAAYSGDLVTQNFGYGIRNDSTTNSQTNSGYLGNITISSTPIDFTDTIPANKVGGPTTSFTKLFDSGGLPLNTGVAGFKMKVKSDFTKRNGIYTETLTVIPFGTY